jgi:hypothetical protein
VIDITTARGDDLPPGARLRQDVGSDDYYKTTFQADDRRRYRIAFSDGSVEEQIQDEVQNATTAALFAQGVLGEGLSYDMALFWIRVDDEILPFEISGNDFSGNDLPGLPRQQLVTEVEWHGEGQRFAAVESQYVGEVYAENYGSFDSGVSRQGILTEKGEQQCPIPGCF